MKVVFSARKLKEDEATTDKIKKALQETADAFAARPLPDRLENFDSALGNRDPLPRHVGHPGQLGGDARLPLVPLRQLDLRPRRRHLPDP